MNSSSHIAKLKAKFMDLLKDFQKDYKFLYGEWQGVIDNKMFLTPGVIFFFSFSALPFPPQGENSSWGISENGAKY